MAFEYINPKVTATDFGKYLAIQRSGVTNMFDIKVVQALTGLSKPKIIYIMEHYAELNAEYNK